MRICTCACTRLVCVSVRAAACTQARSAVESVVVTGAPNGQGAPEHAVQPTSRRRSIHACMHACMHARTHARTHTDSRACMHSYVHVGAADISKTGKLCSTTQGPPCALYPVPSSRHRWGQVVANAMANATPTRGRSRTRGTTRGGALRATPWKASTHNISVK